MKTVIKKGIFAMALGTALVFAGCSGGNTLPPEGDIVLESTVYSDGGTIPAAYSRDMGNKSPSFTWSSVPPESKSLALVMYDLSANNFVHWAVINIPPEVNSIGEGASGTAMPEGSVELINDFGKDGYGGPQPPSGVHRYKTVIYALDVDSISLEGRQSFAQIEEALSGHVLAQGSLTGNFGSGGTKEDPPGPGDDDEGPTPNISSPKTTYTQGSSDGSSISGIYNFGYPTAIFYLKWDKVPGAAQYNVYQSTSASGAGTKLSGEGLTATVFDSRQPCVEGVLVFYYWVTASTSKGETARPANGGVKVSYDFKKEQKITGPGTTITISPGGFNPITGIYKPPTTITQPGTTVTIPGHFKVDILQNGS
jgi:Raf kinase inhibitor-like YbhB/YbcL family protein